MSENKTKFNAEEMKSIVQEVVTDVLKDAKYTHSEVVNWNGQIVDSCLKKLRATYKTYKFVVTCVILQKNGAGFYAGSSVYWDNANDGSSSYRFENDTMYAITNVFALSV
ncbi:Tctex-1 [Hesseltinella vesiculosa]|uniref:Tctex-1 n=1 Tax=Hesseltinella vesiculosa TaxID=101127 RepID=A0A1X2GK75_9FUNG|nr:Tctex-1 [Hesseltinella vesiculosa]